MGNSSSDDKQKEQQDDNGKKLGQYEQMEDCKEKASKTAQKIKQEIQREIEKETAKFEQILKEAKISIEGDKSWPNLVSNHAKLRTMDKPKLVVIDSFVDQMKEGWEEIMKQLPNIREHCGDIGKKKAKTMEKIHTSYWRLLLKTRSKIGLIMTQCKIQKRSISALLEILEEGLKNKLTEDDKLAHADCMRCLGKWIKTDSVKELIEEWKAMGDALEKERSDWPQFTQEAAKLAARAYAWKVAKISGIVLAVIGLLAIATVGIVATLGAATPVVAPGAVAAETALISTAVALAVSLSVGAVVAAGITGAVIAHRKANKYDKAAVKVRMSMDILAGKLEDMFRTGKTMEKELSAMRDEQNNIAEELAYMKDRESVKMIRRSLGAITNYLDEYMSQGKVVMHSIEKAAKQYIDPNRKGKV